MTVLVFRAASVSFIGGTSTIVGILSESADSLICPTVVNIKTRLDKQCGCYADTVQSAVHQI